MVVSPPSQVSESALVAVSFLPRLNCTLAGLKTVLANVTSAAGSRLEPRSLTASVVTVLAGAAPPARGIAPTFTPFPAIDPPSSKRDVSGGLPGARCTDASGAHLGQVPPQAHAGLRWSGGSAVTPLGMRTELVTERRGIGPASLSGDSDANALISFLRTPFGPNTIWVPTV